MLCINYKIKFRFRNLKAITGFVCAHQIPRVRQKIREIKFIFIIENKHKIHCFANICLNENHLLESVKKCNYNLSQVNAICPDK